MQKGGAAIRTTWNSRPWTPRGATGIISARWSRRCHRRGGDHGQHPGYGGLCRPGRVRRTDPLYHAIMCRTSREAVVSVHCHNDLGLAVANSMAAVRHGARQVECTINGIGERAGNAALEEIVMILRTRKDLFSLDTRIMSEKIYPTSRLITPVTGRAGAAQQGHRRRQRLCP